MRFKVLLIEDDINFQEAIQLLLKKLDCIVEVALTGKEALEMTSRENYDAILMDFDLPDMKGSEISRILRSKGNNTIIIATTGHISQYHKQECFNTGMNYFLTKPFSSEDLKSLFIESGLMKQN